MDNILFSITLFFFGLSSGCTSDSSRDMKGYEVVKLTPIVNNDGSINEIKNRYEVFYLNSLFIYQFDYQFDSTVNGQNLIHEWRNNVFIYHKDSSWGQLYYPRENISNTGERVPVDSMLAKNLFENSKFIILQSSRPDSTYSDEAGNFVTMYSLPVSDSFPEPSKARFFYSKKFSGFRESLSKSMDTTKSMKLYKIAIEAQGWFYKQYNLTFPKREYLTELKEIHADNREELLKYADLYKTKPPRSS